MSWKFIRRYWHLRALFVLPLASVLTWATASAEDAVVPWRTQAKLVVKLAEYDRSLVAREGPRNVLIVRNNDLLARRAAEAISMELGTFDTIAGASHKESVIDFVSVSELLKRVQADSTQILYVCPGLESSIPVIAEKLSGVTILSIGAAPSHADLGTVISFDIHSGRAQILVNLKQAQKQHVQLHSEFLKIVKVIR